MKFAQSNIIGNAKHASKSLAVKSRDPHVNPSQQRKAKEHARLLTQRKARSEARKANSKMFEPVTPAKQIESTAVNNNVSELE